MDQLLLVLRWAALAIALILNLWAPIPVGFTHEPELAILALGIYNAAISVAQVRWRWLSPRRMLVLDTVVFSAGIIASGGWHSSLFVLYFLTILVSAIHLRSTESLGYAAMVGILYPTICIPLPNWDWQQTSIEVLVGRTTSLLFVGIVATFFVRQIEAERRLRRAEEGANSRLTALNELMSLELGSKLDLEKTLDGIARLARRAINAEFSAVCLFSSQERPGLTLAFDGVPSSKQGTLFGDAHLDPVGEIVARTGRPLLIADVSRGPDGVDQIASFYRCRSLVCTPIKLEEKVIGVLYGGVMSPEQIGQNDVDLLVAMGRHTGLAIANAEMYDRERSNAERLQRLEQMKSEFLSTVSHQLRTPITSIATSADLLAADADGLTEDQQKLVQNVARNSLRLDNLVADILEMSRLSNTQINLALQPLLPRTIANDAVSGMKLLLDAREQIVEVRVDPGLPRVEADRRKIEHVLVNLLSNACRFTQRRGTILLEARVKGEMVEFAVRDNGPGMDRESVDRAFEPFYSANGSEGQGGTGLGLAIAKGLVELHGGEIFLESAPGSGTTVRFTLPKSRQ
jgi:signal transduction histidine kinase